MPYGNKKLLAALIIVIRKKEFDRRLYGSKNTPVVAGTTMRGGRYRFKLHRNNILTIE